MKLFRKLVTHCGPPPRRKAENILLRMISATIKLSRCNATDTGNSSRRQLSQTRLWRLLCAFVYSCPETLCIWAPPAQVEKFLARPSSHRCINHENGHRNDVLTC